MKQSMAFIFLVFLFLLLDARAYAIIRYVDNLCTGNVTTYNSSARTCVGGSEFGYETSQAAANAASGSDVVMFRSGTYGAFTVVNNGTDQNNHVVFQNYGYDSTYGSGEQAIIRGTPVSCVLGTCQITLDNRNYITIQGLIIGGSGFSASNGIGGLNASYVNIINNEVSFQEGSGMSFGYSGDTHHFLIQGNRIHDNAQANIEQSGQRKRGAILQGQGSWGAGFIANNGSRDFTIVDNVVYFNHGEGLSVVGARHTVRNNIVSDNWSVNIYCQGCYESTFERNLAYESADVVDYPFNSTDNIPNGWSPSTAVPGAASIATGDPYINNTTNNVWANNILFGGVTRWVSQNPVTDDGTKIYSNTFLPLVTGAEGGYIHWTNPGGTISNLSIRNNIFYLTSDLYQEGAIRVTPAATSRTISNNIYFSTVGQSFVWGSTRYTTLASWKAASGDTSGTNYDATANPQLGSVTSPCRLWVDPRGQLGPPCTPSDVRTATTNYKMYSGSPALDVGANLGSPYNTDFVGNARAFAGPWDLGAFEYGTPIVSPVPQLVAAYGFDSIEGQTVYDSSGLNNNGTMDATVVVDSSGKYGKALLFNGSNAVTVPNSASLSFTDGLTIEAWVNVPTAPTTSTAVMAKFYDYYLYINSEPWQCAGQRPFGGAVTSGQGQIVCDSTAGFPANTWVHLAVTWDSSTFLFYRDGQITSSRSANGPMTASSGPLYIGNSGFPEYFTGKIDEVRIYTGALTQSQIQFDMTNPITPLVPPEKIIQIAPPNTLELSATDGALQIGE